MFRQVRRNEEGQTLPLTVLLMLVLLGVLALVLDGGFAFVQKRRAQNAADAGALSGAVAMVNGEYRDAVLRQTVAQYATSNGAASTTMHYLDSNGDLIADPSNGLVPTSAAAISVTTQIPFATFLASVLGVNNMTAAAQARAAAMPAALAPSFQGLAPLSVPVNFYDACSAPTSSCNIWDSQYRQQWGTPATFKGILDLSDGTVHGSMPQTINAWTQYGYEGTVNANTTLPIITGDYGSNVAAALRARITAHPGGVDPDGVVWGTIDMVVWDGYNNGRVHVQKFARFKIRMTEIFGSSVLGHFVSYVVPGHTRGPDLPAGPKVIVLR